MISDLFIFAMILVGLLIAAMIVILVATHKEPTHWERYNGEKNLTEAGAFRRVSVSIIVALLLIAALFIYPFEKEHHWYLPYTETIVETTASTFSVNEDQEFRIELSNGIVFRSDDYRFVGLQVGDTVKVNCIRNWNYTSQDDYDCEFAE